MYTISEEELGVLPALGETVHCQICGGVHEIIYGEEILKDKTRIPCRDLAFYTCGEKTYLAGFKGRALSKRNIPG